MTDLSRMADAVIGQLRDSRAEVDSLRTALVALTMATERLLEADALPPDVVTTRTAVAQARAALGLGVTEPVIGHADWC